MFGHIPRRRLAVGFGVVALATVVAGWALVTWDPAASPAPRPQGAESSLAASSPAPQPAAITLPVELPDGRRTLLSAPDDCRVLTNGFLAAWCTATFGATIEPFERLDPTSGDWAKYYAALSAAVVRGDESICDLAQVQRHILASGDRAAACRESLAGIRSRGWYSVTDPATGISVVVSLGSWPAPLE